MKTSITIAAPQTTSSGPKCLIGGMVRPMTLRAAVEKLAGLVQVAREEDDHADLSQLRGLERERAQVDCEEGAVDLRTDARNSRGQEQGDGAERDQVPVALEHVVVAQEDDRRGKSAEPDQEHRRLLDGEASRRSGRA